MYSEIPTNFGADAWTPSPTPKVALSARSIKRHAETVTEFNGKLLEAIKRKEVDKAAYIRYFLASGAVLIKEHCQRSGILHSAGLGSN